jgi:protease-4
MPPPGYGGGPGGGYPTPGWYPPPKPPRNFSRAIFTTLATTVFGISLMANIYLLLLSGLFGDHSGKASTSTVTEGDPKQVVAVVPIETSMISQGDAELLDKRLKEVEENDNVKALVLRINTPGGEVSPSDEMYNRILQFRARKPNIPVVVSMGGMATSGGYYIACAGQWLVAEQTTWTANIGVRADSINLSKLGEKWGIQDTSLHNRGANFKTAGSMWREPTQEENDYLIGLLDSAADRFHDVVKTGRQGRLKAPLAQIFEAQAYPAKPALEMGLVDQIGYLSDACAYAAAQAKLSNMTVIKFEEPSLLQKLLTGKSGLPAPSADQTVKIGAVKIDGVEIQADQLDRFLHPRPMYLWRGN